LWAKQKSKTQQIRRKVMQIHQLTAIPCLIAASLLVAQADVTVTKSTTLAAQGQITVNETGCQNNPGPWVTLDGDIAFDGLGLRLIFQNNEKGTHTATVTYETNAVLLNLGESITIPKQPVLGGVGGNPHISIQFLHSSGELMGDEIYLGRCVQGLTLSPDFLLDAVAAADLAVGDCANHQGPWITISGGISLSGVDAKIIFRNNVKGTHTAEAEATVTLIANGTTIQIPKQPVRGGAGGNPLISVQFLNGAGEPIGKAIRLGKCVQL
jgi:hypothetical protein